MAIKFLAVTLFFALVVLKPVHDAFPDKDNILRGNGTHNDTRSMTSQMYGFTRFESGIGIEKHKDTYDRVSSNYLWTYLVFVYVFTALAVYLLVTESERIIAIRQEYLGSQATITDRTIRLSGIPKSLRSEAKIKDFIERLQIGKVDSVTLCRNWKEIDDLFIKRDEILRKLEESWTVFLGQRRVERNLESLPIAQPPPPGPDIDPEEDEESGRLLGSGADDVPYARNRPTTYIQHGFMKLQRRKVDAIDYYEEKLRRIDEEITELRKKEFEPIALAFVTLDSVAACVGHCLRMARNTSLINNSKWLCKPSLTRHLYI